MQILVPISKSKNVCVRYNNDNDIVFSNLANISNNDDRYVVFDIFKALQYFNFNKNKKFYDIDIIYRLSGYKFESFSELVDLVLGQSSSKYYKELNDKITGHQNSYKAAKIDISKFYVENLYPKSLIVSLYKERARLIKVLYDRIKDNTDTIGCYDSLYDSILSLCEIQRNEVYFDRQFLVTESSQKSKNILSLLNNDKCNIKLNVVGAKTGRLSIKKNCVNIYNLPKTLRKAVVAQPGKKIYEFDFKNFQPRLAIFSTSDEKFKDKFKEIHDIYAVFPGNREENKIDLISWMYSNHKNLKFDVEAKPIKDLRESLYLQAKQNNVIKNGFDRPLHFDNEEANVVFQNYITSLEADIVIRLTHIIHSSIFKNTASRVLFPFHDSIVCEIDDKDYLLVEAIKTTMEGFLHSIYEAKFPTNVKCGNNFGEMKEILL